MPPPRVTIAWLQHSEKHEFIWHAYGSTQRTGGMSGAMSAGRCRGLRGRVWWRGRVEDGGWTSHRRTLAWLGNGEGPLTSHSRCTDMGGIRTRQEARPQFWWNMRAFRELCVVLIFVHFGQHTRLMYSHLQNDRQVEKSQTGQVRMPKPSESAVPVIALVAHRDLKVTGGDLKV